MVMVAVGLGASTLMVSLALCCDGSCEACLGFTCGLGLVLGVLDLGITSGLCALEGVVGTLEGGCGLSSNFGGCLGLGLAVSPLGGCAGKDVLGLGCTVGGIVLLVVASNGHLLVTNTLLDGGCFDGLLVAEVVVEGGALLQVTLLSGDVSLVSGMVVVVSSSTWVAVSDHGSWVSVSVC